MSVDTKELCRIAGDVSDEISFSCGEVVYDAAREIRTLRAEVERLREVERAAIGVVEFCEAYAGARDVRELEVAWATLWDKIHALCASLATHSPAKESPCKP